MKVYIISLGVMEMVAESFVLHAGVELVWDLLIGLKHFIHIIFILIKHSGASASDMFRSFIQVFPLICPLSVYCDEISTLFILYEW